MKKQLLILVTIVIAVFLNSCNTSNAPDKYQATTKQFTDELLQKNYDKCISLMALDRISSKKIHPDSIKAGLNIFRSVLSNNFGNKLDFSFIKAQKNYPKSSDAEVAISKSTYAYIQYSNGKDYGMIQALFDDQSGKIIDIKTLDVKRPIPDMTWFWVFGIIALCIPAFNIYTIVKVYKSTMVKKWQKYLAIVILNVPSIGYNPIGGLFFKLLTPQFILGVTYKKLDYINTAWVFGIPIASLYILWLLKTGKYKSTVNNDNKQVKKAG